MKPARLVSGERNSWLTFATKSRRTFSRFRCNVISRTRTMICPPSMRRIRTLNSISTLESGMKDNVRSVPRDWMNSAVSCIGKTVSSCAPTNPSPRKRTAAVFADWISPVAVAMISPSSSMRPISEKRAGWSCGAVSAATTRAGKMRIDMRLQTPLCRQQAYRRISAARSALCAS